MATNNNGQANETWLLTKFLPQNKFEIILQADGLGKRDGQWYLFETKTQARFKSPPFDGHGLPIWQVKARLSFQEDTGVIVVFVINDSETGEVFYERLDKLERGQHFDTSLNKRRIYPLKHFKVFPKGGLT